MAAVGPRQQPLRRTHRQRLRLAFALLLSTLFHALLLSLTFVGDEFGVPGFAFPWQVRRIEVPNLQVVLAPAPVINAIPASPPEPPPLPLPQPHPEASNEQTAATGELVVTIRSPEASPEPPARATGPRNPPTAKASAKPADATRKEPAPASLVEPPPPKPFPAVIALERSQNTDFVVPAAPLEPPPVQSTTPAHGDGETLSSSEPPALEPVVEKTTQTESARQETERQEGVRQAAAKEEAARREAERQENARQAAAREEAARAEAAQRETERQENTRQAAAKEEAARAEAARRDSERQESARQAAAKEEATRVEAARREAERQEKARQAAVKEEAARAEAARREAERQENARQAAAREEAARAETARREAERQEAARQATAREEAARADAARRESERQENARQAAAREEAARAEEKREQDARRDAARRAIGRQLDEEAARRAAAEEARRLSPSSSLFRRGRLFGRSDPNAELVLYAEAWSRKIHLNMGFETVREAAKQTHTDPLVTIAIRRDGSVESISFVRSSGVPAIDEAIRRIVQDHSPYQPFQPALARDFDVIEIRRTWHFDSAIRLY